MTPARPTREPQKGPPATHTPSPQESLGLAARGGLVAASVQAAIGFAVLFAALTFGPYFWEKSHAATKPGAPEKGDAPVAAQPSTPVAPPPSTPDPSAAKLPPAGAPVAGKQPAAKGGDLLDKLGESGTKAAPAKVNPLDKKDDDILKDLKP